MTKVADPNETKLQTFTSVEAIERAKGLIIKDPRKFIPIINRNYGEGMASKILDGQVEPVLPEGKGFFGGIKSWFDDQMDGVDVEQAMKSAGEYAELQNTNSEDRSNVLSAITDIPVALADGIETAITESAETVGIVNDAIEDKFNLPRLTWGGDDNRGLSFMSNEEVQERRDPDFEGERLDIESTYGKVEQVDIIPEPKTMAGGMTKAITQFVTGFVALGGGKGKLVKSMFVGAVVDASVFDGYDQNLSGLAQEYGWADNYITQALATDPDAPEWQNKLRNSAEGLALGGLVEGLIKAIRLGTHSRNAKNELNKTGKVSEETQDKVLEAQDEVYNFADLDGKPKGTMTPEGTFVTNDGMTFDVKTGNRIFDEPVAPVSVDAVPVDETAPVKLENPDRSKLPTEIDVKPIKKNKVIKPSELIDNKALLQAAKNSSKINEVVTIGQINELGDNVGLFNFDKFDGPMDAIKVIDQVGDVLSASGFMKNVEKTQTWESINKEVTQELADITGTNMSKLNDVFEEQGLSGVNLTKELVKFKIVLQSSGKRIKELSDLVADMEVAGNVNTVTERKLVDLLNFHVDTQYNLKNLQTNIARAQNIGRMRTANALDDTLLDRLEQFGGSKKVRKLAKQIKLNNNPRAQSKLIKKYVERTWLGKSMDVVNEVFINNILSGYHTHALNIGANTVNMFVRPAIRYAGGAVTGNKQMRKEAAFQLYYIGEELKNVVQAIATVNRAGDNSLSDMLKSFGKNQAVLDQSGKFDPSMSGSSIRSVSSKNLGGGIAVDGIGNVITLAGRFLGAEDELFKQIVFRSRLKAMVNFEADAMTAEQFKALGYKNKEDFVIKEIELAKNTQETLAEEFQVMVKKGMVNDDPKLKDEFIKQNLGSYNANNNFALKAVDEARETTFTSPLREGTWIRSIQKMANQYPLAKQVVPFIQTPANILRTSFERAPVLNLIMKRQREILKNGTAEEKAMIAGSQVVGTLFTTMAIIMAYNGRTTGGGPNYQTDPALAKLYNASPNFMPYSINVSLTDGTEKWIELKKLDPHGFQFGIIGDLVEMQEYLGETKDPEVEELLGMVMASMSNNVMSKSWLQPVADIMSLFDGSAEPYEWSKFISDRAAAMVPLSGLQYQANTDYDGVSRDLRTLTDKVKARILGQNDAAIKVDWLTGEDVLSPNYYFGFIRQKTVDNGTHENADVYKELMSLNYGFQGPKRKIGDIELGPKVFQRYNHLLGTMKLSGRTLAQEIEKKIKSSNYKKDKLTTERLRTTPENDPNVQDIQAIIESYKSSARIRLFREFPELMKMNEENKSIRRKIQNGNQTTNEDGLVFEFNID